MTVKQNLYENILELGKKETWHTSLEVIENSIKALFDSKHKNKLLNIKRVYITGCGTSLYAGIVGKYFFGHIAGIPAEAVPANTFQHYYSEMLDKDVLVVGISTTGGTKTICENLELAKRKGAFALAITSNANSEIAKTGDACILSGNFDDRTVVKSKSYVYSQMTLCMLAASIRSKKEEGGNETYDYWKLQIIKASYAAENFAKKYLDVMDDLSDRMMNAGNIFVIGAGPGLGTVEEAALKIVEMARSYAEGHEVEDFLHGRFRVVDKNSPFFVIAPKGNSDERILDFLTAAKAVGAHTVVLTGQYSENIEGLATEIITFETELDEYITPMLYILPFYMLGYKIGEKRGHDPGARRYWIVPQETYFNVQK